MYTLEIRSIADQFRRAGLAFTRNATTVDGSTLTLEQIYSLVAEPQLIVRAMHERVGAEPVTIEGDGLREQLDDAIRALGIDAARAQWDDARARAAVELANALLGNTDAARNALPMGLVDGTDSGPVKAAEVAPKRGRRTR